MNISDRIIATIDTANFDTLTYKVSYLDKTNNDIKTLMYVGKVNSFGKPQVDIYLNQIIKDVPLSSDYYDQPVLSSTYKFTPINLITDIIVDVDNTGEVVTFSQLFFNYRKEFGVDDRLDQVEPGDLLHLKSSLYNHGTITQSPKVISVVFFSEWLNQTTSFSLRYDYTDGTWASVNNFHTLTTIYDSAYLFQVKESTLYNTNPNPTKTIKSITLSSDTDSMHLINFDNDSCKKNEISFIGRNGGINNIIIKGNTIYSEGIKRKSVIDLYDTERIYSINVENDITINTGWLTDEQSKDMEELFVTKQAYFYEYSTQSFIPVSVKETSYERKQYKNGRQLINYTINLAITQKEII